MFYLLVHLLLTVVFYLVGVVRCHVWQTRQEPVAYPGHQASELGDVHHVVIIPNYNEPMEILRRTLHALAERPEARHHLTVVLAMEEREPAALNKARALRALFADRFARLLVTVHPADRPGEIAGKSSNEAWAARQAKQELVERLGLPIEHLTLTICDADSLIHPRYFTELTRLFINDPQRHLRFWYAPLFYQNNVWQVPAAIRLLAFSTAAGRLGELARPLSWPLPTSTYTLSFKLADDVGYWDPVVISEDWHMYLRCFFAKHGRTNLVPIFLPTQADAASGETLRQALRNYYRQELRHAWGAEDVGYILQQWRRSPDTPAYKKLLCFCWILHVNLLRSTAWFILGLGSLAAALPQDTPIINLPGQSIGLDLLQFVNALGVVGAVAIWAVERTRCLPHDKNAWVISLAQELVAWAFLPILTLGLKALPGLHAQTKLLMGSRLAFRRTPKSTPSPATGTCPSFDLGGGRGQLPDQ
jgi:hypothetical protein